MTIDRKHFDFQVPAWGEFMSGPQGDGVGVTLSQSADAAYPERIPSGGGSGGGVGLLVALSSGSGDEYLEHDLIDEQTRFNVRVLLNPGSAAGGEVEFMRGVDGVGTETFNLAYDAVNRRVWLDLASGGTTWHDLPGDPGVMDWHVIELAVDTDAGTADLWINGVKVQTIGESMASVATAAVRLGCTLKDTDTTGDLYLDDWVIDEAYIGPHVVSLSSDDATDPGSYPGSYPGAWLVLYNTAFADSVAWVESYRQAHGVPYANLLGLSLSLTDQIMEGQWDVMRDAITGYLALHFADGHIKGILIGYGVPGCVGIGGTDYTISSLLAQPGNTTPGLSNPSYVGGSGGVDDLPDRSTLHGSGRYLVAEMNAPTLTDAQALITRPAALSTTAGDGEVLSTMDPDDDRLAMAVTAGQWPVYDDWVGTVEAQRLRLPVDGSYDGTDHGHAVELCQSNSGQSFGVSGQAKAVLVTIGTSGAGALRSA